MWQFLIIDLIISSVTLFVTLHALRTEMVPSILLLAALSTFSSAESLPNATFRAQQALGGLISYYWQQDPNAKDVRFFFSCAQIATAGDTKHCSCYTVKPCVTCYRWWDAIALEAIANYGIYTNTTVNSNIADVIFAYSPYNKDWNAVARCTFVDDFAWYGIAYLRVYEWLKVTMNVKLPLLVHCLHDTVISICI